MGKKEGKKKKKSFRENPENVMYLHRVLHAIYVRECSFVCVVLSVIIKGRQCDTYIRTYVELAHTGPLTNFLTQQNSRPDSKCPSVVYS